MLAASFDVGEVGIESASDDRSITSLEGTTKGKLVVVAAVAVAVGIAAAAAAAAVVVAEEDYKEVVDAAVDGNQSWNHLNFERTRCCS